MSEGSPILAREHDPQQPGEPSVPDVYPLAEVSASPDHPVPCEFLTGRAGTGKTYAIRQRIAEDEHYGVLCATTGIAAVNLDSITINSLLGYFDTDSLRDAYLCGRMTRTLASVAKSVQRVVIDEHSMMEAPQLELIYRAIYEVNTKHRVGLPPLGLTLVGDFAQLPPVRGLWAFEADCWPEFALHTTSLTKMWRQDEPIFLEALQACRTGRGRDCVDLLVAGGVKWNISRDLAFGGTTIVPKNALVDRHNDMVLGELPGKPLPVNSRRWGRQRKEWDNIPPTLRLKDRAYVMILANCTDPDQNSDGLAYANGDCGYVRGFEDGDFVIELLRGKTVYIGSIVRDVAVADKPHPGPWYKIPGYDPTPHRNVNNQYVLGQVEYYPLRPAWASTVHKSQGLSLDRCQIDFRDSFFGAANMLYVALSRCRTLAGLRLVGDPQTFIRRCNVDPRVAAWL